MCVRERWHQNGILCPRFLGIWFTIFRPKIASRLEHCYRSNVQIDWMRLGQTYLECIFRLSRIDLSMFSYKEDQLCCCQVYFLLPVGQPSESGAVCKNEKHMAILTSENEASRLNSQQLFPFKWMCLPCYRFAKRVKLSQNGLMQLACSPLLPFVAVHDPAE